MNLADVQADLYGEPPGEFVRRRAEQVRAAKQRGDRELADAIAALRKPSAAAAALNSFARASPDEVGTLLDVGGRLRVAIERGDGDEIRAAMRERGRIVVEVMRSVHRHADDLGEPLSASAATQVEQSLRAATTSEEYADQLRRGVLVSALSESATADLPTSIGPSATRRDDGAATTARRRATEEQKAAADAVDRARGELDDARRRRSEIDAELQTLSDRLNDVTQRLDAARAAESDAESRLEAATAQLEEARSGARLRRS